MTLPVQLAQHMRDVYLSGNWTATNLRDQLSGVSWEEAVTQVGDLNTIAILATHIHYFVRVQIRAMKEGVLVGKDAESFDHPPIRSAADWDRMREDMWTEAEEWASLVEAMPEKQIWAPFLDGKYGTWYQNLHGLIEHTNYHLGQVGLIRKLLASGMT